MPLVSARVTIVECIESDKEFAIAVFCEAIEAFLEGEVDVSLLLLRDLVSGSIGFGPLAIATEISSKSLHRMLSAHGNPSMENFSQIIQALRGYLGIDLHIGHDVHRVECIEGG